MWQIAVLILIVASECQGQVRPAHCDLAPEEGPCDGVCMRWYYDVRDRECKQFQWGCCGGNDNKYETAVECYRGCANPGACSQPPESGDCEGMCSRWYFDNQVGMCRHFHWGCCEGNDNKFPDEDTCIQFCTGEN